MILMSLNDSYHRLFSEKFLLRLSSVTNYKSILQQKRSWIAPQTINYEEQPLVEDFVKMIESVKQSN